MQENWYVERLQIREGFFQELDIHFPKGLTCIIGPRGSGKSTLAEALRYCICGQDVGAASKQRQDLLKFNLNKSTIVTTARSPADESIYTVRREARQRPIITTSDGRLLSGIDLDRGTFLPLDGYSGIEIEELAKERLGPKRRMLLDELQSSELQQMQLNISAARRKLEENADKVQATRREIANVEEQVLVLAEAPSRLDSLPPAPESSSDIDALSEAARQDQVAKDEATGLKQVSDSLLFLVDFVDNFTSTSKKRLGGRTTIEFSCNVGLTSVIDDNVKALLDTICESATEIKAAIQETLKGVTATGLQLEEAHLRQQMEYSQIKEKNQAAGQIVRERTEAQEAVNTLRRIEKSLIELRDTEAKLLAGREILRGELIQFRDEVSTLRESVAQELVRNAGENVRIRIRRNADKLDYEMLLSDGLRGAGVKNHDAIIEQVTRLRPDELAQILHQRKYEEFEAVCKLGAERSRRIVDAFCSSLDLLALEMLPLEDIIGIELNVGSPINEHYKDAADLSLGQKSTALLPLLLARRQSPLVIDQPEDNLDNHFIFRTVVRSLLRLKTTRQMIFITHNANIPVLAEAELVVVLGSDGRNGYVEKLGSLDECQEEIVNLLEGGKEAFEKRRLRYEHS